MENLFFGVIKKPAEVSSYNSYGPNLLNAFRGFVRTIPEKYKGNISLLLAYKNKCIRTLPYNININNDAPNSKNSGFVVLKSKLTKETLLDSSIFKRLEDTALTNLYSIIGNISLERTPYILKDGDTQPHIKKTIVGMSSGKILNKSFLLKKFSIPDNKSDTDIFFAIVDLLVEKEKMPIKEALAEAGSLIQGYFSGICFPIKERHNVFLIRRGFPLTMKFRSVGNSVFISNQETHVDRMYVESKMEPEQSKYFIELFSYKLPDNSCLLLNGLSTAFGDWVRKADPSFVGR